MDAEQGPMGRARVIPKPAIAVWAVLFVAALAATGSYDERISQRFADPRRPWALFFEGYGEIPGYLTSAIGAAIVLATNNPKTLSGESYDRGTLAANAVCLGWLCLRLTAVVYKSSGEQLSQPVATACAMTIIGYAQPLARCAARRTRFASPH